VRNIDVDMLCELQYCVGFAVGSPEREPDRGSNHFEFPLQGKFLILTLRKKLFEHLETRLTKTNQIQRHTVNQTHLPILLGLAVVAIFAQRARAQDVLPRPEQPFGGYIARKAQDSIKDFPEEVSAPKGVGRAEKTSLIAAP
jgi:hypothetical protein